MTEVITKDRVIRDGKVAVVYSPGFGAGWSTWADSEIREKIVFDPEIVSFVESNDKNGLSLYMALKYPDAYTGGMDDLIVDWLPVGTLFRIHEYDGNESIEVKEDMDWLIA